MPLLNQGWQTKIVFDSIFFDRMLITSSKVALNRRHSEAVSGIMSLLDVTPGAIGLFVTPFNDYDTVQNRKSKKKVVILALKKIHIDKIISNGMGIGRDDDGKVVMMPYVLPGEEVAYRVTRQRKNYADARPVAIITPSPHRINPLCPHFTYCGGCDYQHIEYGHQLFVKGAAFAEQVGHFISRSGLDVEEIRRGVTPSGNPFAYRQRLRMHVSDHGRIGFHKPTSNDLEPVVDCPLAREEINHLLRLLPESASFKHLLAHQREVEIISSVAEQRIILIFHSKRKPRADDIDAAHNLLNDFSQIKSVVLSGVGFQRCIVSKDNIDHAEALKVRLPFDVPAQNPLRYELSLEAGGFSQINHDLNQDLIATLLSWVGERKPKHVLDMFCGMGNFSIPLAMNGYTVSGFDQQRSAIRSGQGNAANLKLECDFFRASSEEGLKTFTQQGRECDLLVIDPPRKGCRETISDVIKSSCRSVIYVSCDPATLCRDLIALMEHDFQISKIAGFDMFPQTRHLEVMVLLTR